MTQMIKIFNKTMSTKALTQALPTEFTKAQYDDLCHKNPHFCNAYELLTLRKGGLVVIVRTEHFVKEIQKWNYMARTYEPKLIEVQRHFYSLTEKGKTFFAQVLDN